MKIISEIKKSVALIIIPALFCNFSTTTAWSQESDLEDFSIESSPPENADLENEFSESPTKEPVADSSSASPSLEEPPPPPKKHTKYIKHPNAAKGLVKIRRDGTYLYRTKRSPQDRTFSLKATTLTAPTIVGYQPPDGKEALTYEDIYKNRPLSGAFFEYEWMLNQKVGDIALQAGSGLFTTSGKGRFKNNPTKESIEKYYFFAVPLTFGILYRMNYWNRQFLVPYGSIGGQYIGLLEVRDDAKKINPAGSIGATGSAGVLFNISRWGDRSAYILDNNYGINDLWLSVEYRRLQSVKKEMDFSSNAICVGFSMDM